MLKRAKRAPGPTGGVFFAFGRSCFEGELLHVTGRFGTGWGGKMRRETGDWRNFFYMGNYVLHGVGMCILPGA